MNPKKYDYERVAVHSMVSRSENDRITEMCGLTQSSRNDVVRAALDCYYNYLKGSQK